MLNTKDFIRAIAKETGYSQKDITAVLEAAESVMIDAVANGDGVKMFKSLKIVPVIKKGRTLLNLHTREQMVVPDKKAPKAEFSKAFKDVCNK